jgi:hypothetical protein
MMKTVIDPDLQVGFYPATENNTLTAIYPQLYCPRCGSYEIGLRRLYNNEIIWGCRDCAVLFNLDFPRSKRF